VLIVIASEPAGSLNVAILVNVLEQHINYAKVVLFLHIHTKDTTVVMFFNLSSIIIACTSFIVVAIDTKANVNNAIITLLLNTDIVLAIKIKLIFVTTIIVIECPVGPFEMVSYWFWRLWAHVSITWGLTA
jgi:hypothetical protein